MLFLKNIQFTHLVKINGHLKEFNFRKSNASLQTIFTIDTSDPEDPSNRLVFHMHNAGNEWKIMQRELREWIMENESQLNTFIQKELAVQEIYFIRPSTNAARQFNRFFSLFGLG